MEFVQPIRDKTKIEEVKAILRRKSYRDYMLFMIGINTGLRISDLLKLTIGDVRGKDKIDIREKKTGKAKRFKIPEKVLAELEEYMIGMKDDALLFPSERSKDKPVDRVRVYRILNEAAQEAGITDPIGTHTLRKTFGYHFYKKTKDVAILQDIFNHSAPSVTRRYIGINEDEIDKALEGFEL